MPVSNADWSFPVRGGTVSGPGTPHASTMSFGPCQIASAWSTPIAMLSIIRVLWKLFPHFVGVLSVVLPYCVMSSRLKLPVIGSVHGAWLRPPDAVFKHVSPEEKPE